MEKIILNEHTRSARKKWAWTATNIKRANNLVEIANDYHDYWPLTERFFYYRLIGRSCVNGAHWCKYGKAENPQVKVYDTIYPLLKWLRIDGYLPWGAVIDDQRFLSGKVGFEDPSQFINQELDGFLEGYRKCLAHKQDYFIEVWMEKATLMRIVKPVTDKYCRRLMCCKGYNSVTFQADFIKRTEQALMNGQTPVVLYFGDWDPSGVNMIYAAAQTLIDEMGLVGTKFYRCGINPEQFSGLIKKPVPLKLKKEDSRFKKFIQKHGKAAYELDAFEPEELQALVEKSILAFTDRDGLEESIQAEPEDLRRLEIIKSKVINLVNNELRQ